MGQKIHPTGFRLAVTRDWSSRWYASSKDFPGMLNEDIRVREYLKRKLAHASVGRVLIERPAKNARVTIYSARPGVVIGKKGEDIGRWMNDGPFTNGLPRESPGHLGEWIGLRMVQACMKANPELTFAQLFAINDPREILKHYKPR